MSLAASLPAGGAGRTADRAAARWTVWSRGLILALLAAAALRLGAEGVYVLLGANIHEVIPGRVYRAAQPTPAVVAELVAQYGIRTIINLRGCAAPLDWYLEEARATCAQDICQEDIALSAGRVPSSTELRRLIEVLDRAAYPVLIHCRRGADRTGLTSVVILLLQEGVTLADARAALGVRYGHVSIGRPARMAEFFRYYEDWLRDNHLDHAPAIFRRWALTEYRGGPCRCVIEQCTFPPGPVRAGKGFALQVRVRNAGSRAWRFSPVSCGGVHLQYVLYGVQAGQEVSDGRAGLFDATVAPGASIDLTLPVAPIPAPGRYWLRLDMIDEQMGGFYQMGSEPFEMRLDVRE